MSFKIFDCGRGSRSDGFTVKLNKNGASLSKQLRQALPDGYEVAVDSESGQVAVVIGGPRQAHNGQHKALSRALISLGGKEGQSWSHAAGQDPLPIGLDDGGRLQAFVFNVRAAGGKR